MSQDVNLVKITDFGTISASLYRLLKDQKIVEVRLMVESSAIFLEGQGAKHEGTINFNSALVIYGDSSLSGVREGECSKRPGGFDSDNFGLLLGERIKSVQIMEDGRLDIVFHSTALLSVAGHQTSEIEESWMLFASADIYNTDIYSRAVPNANLIAADSCTGDVFAYLQREIIVSNQK